MKPLGREDGPFGKQHTAFDDVAKLSDISWPIVISELLPDLIWDGSHLFCRLGIEFCNEERDQLIKILSHFPQGGEMNFEDAQPVIEITSKAALPDHGFKVTVTGGKDLDIHTDFALGTEASKFTILNGF